MATLVQPDWDELSCRQALKTVIKWEIQNLLQRLAETGEEALLLTASLEDGNIGELGSERGQNFLMVSDLDQLKSQFLTYCKACFVGEETEPYRDLVSGEIVIGPKTFLNSSCGRRQKRKKSSSTRLRKLAKLRHNVSQDGLDGLSEEEAELPRDNPGGAGVTVEEVNNIEKSDDPRNPERSKGTTSRRKRTPKKVMSCYDTESDTDENRLVSQQVDKVTIKTEPVCDYDYDNIHANGNQSDEFDQTGAQTFSILTQKNAQSRENQSADSDNSSKDGLQSSFALKNSIHSVYQNNQTNIRHKLNPWKKTKSRREQNSKANGPYSPASSSSRVHMGPKLEPEASWEPAGQDKDPDGGYMFPVTMVNEDGSMKIVTKVEPGVSSDKMSDPFSAEELDLFRIAPSRPPGKGFKAAGSDEVPSETALLDAAKLGVGRYQCPWCTLIVRDRHDLKRHLRTHTKQKPYQCSLCLRKFSRKWDLENHLRRHQEETLNEKLLTSPMKMVNLSETQLHDSWVEAIAGKLDLQNASANQSESESVQNQSDESVSQAQKQGQSVSDQESV